MKETETSSIDQNRMLDFRREIPVDELLLTEEELQSVMEHFHFPEAERDEIFLLQGQIKGVLQCRGIFLTLPEAIRQEAVPYGKMVLHRQDTVLGAITLGESYDRLQKDYMERQQLSQSYRMEMLGMEYLRKGYALFNKSVYEEGLGYPGEYHYLEDSQQIRQACIYLKNKQFMAIDYNRYGVLTPSKSVIFKASLKQGAGSNCTNICASCTAIHCSFRRR